MILRSNNEKQVVKNYLILQYLDEICLAYLQIPFENNVKKLFS